ncbi:MAG: PP2C family serine/threonine-protein phosphatase [Candidatus Dormibacteria bacterium]
MLTLRKRIVMAGANFDAIMLSSAIHSPNQDAMLTTNGFCGVFDGATPLTGEAGSMVSQFAQLALEKLRVYASSEITTAFRKAITELDLPRFSNISGAVAVLSEDPSSNDLVATALGDCFVVARSRRGQVTIVSDPRLEQLDDIAIQEMASYLARGMSPQEAWQKITTILVSHHNLRNTLSGYWIFGGNPASADHLQQAVFSDGIDSALVCSDGFMRLVKPFGVASSEAELLEMVKSQGLEQMLRQLRRSETKESSMLQFPRFNVSDDATAVLLTSSK